MADLDAASNWAAMIPEVYYDLIARLPAGSFLAVCLYLVLTGKNLGSIHVADLQWADSILLVLLLLFAGYSLGLLIGPLGNCVYEWWFPGFWRRSMHSHKHVLSNEKIKKQLDCLKNLPEEALSADKLDPKPKQCRKKYGQMYRQMNDYLKVKCHPAGAILPKMQAEADLCSNFAVAGAIALVLLTLKAYRDFHTWWFVLLNTWWFVLLSLTGIACALWASRYQTRLLVERLFSFFSIVVGQLEKHQSASVEHQVPC
jgi:hypothetical protein